MRKLTAPTLALALVVGAAPTPSSGAPAFDPARYMPPKAGGVLVFEDVRGTLLRLENMAQAAGVAPPGSESGWLQASLLAEFPTAAELDLARPIWVGFMPQSKAAVESDELPKAVLVLPIKGQGEGLVEALKADMKVARRPGWIIAVDKKQPDRLLKPHAKPFSLPAHLDRLRKSADLFGVLSVAANPALFAAEDDASDLSAVPPVLRPLMTTAQQMQADQMKEMEAFSFGVGVATDGFDVLMQLHPRPGTDLAKTGRATKNYEGPLLEGLPPEDYVVVMAARPPTDAPTDPWTDALVTMLRSSDDLDPEVEKKFKELQAITAKDAKCRRVSAGVLVSSSANDLRVLASSDCGSSSKLTEKLRDLAGWSADFMTLVSEQPEQTPPEQKASPPNAVKLVHEKGARRVGSKKLDVARMEFSDAHFPPENREAAAVLRQPLVFGPVDADTTVIAWNAPEPLLQRAVAAAEKGGPVKLPAAAAATARLLAPRHTEAYLFVAPLVSAFAPADVSGMLGPLRFLLAQMPPLGVAIQTQPDGSQLYQLFLPQQLAQLALSVAQMQQ